MKCPIIQNLTNQLHRLDDPMCSAIAEKMRLRSSVGVAKYGQSLAREDITLYDWLNHAQQEALDLAAYIEAIHHHHPSIDLMEMQERVLADATELESRMQAIEEGRMATLKAEH